MHNAFKGSVPREPQSINRRISPNGCCAVYRSWLSEMKTRGGPTPMEAVAWYLIRSHAERCEYCHVAIQIEVEQLNCRIARSYAL